ncbi:MAG: hypothetical protein M1830_010124 [Pleopsidium flavum]|nr:MAG: hypothetical protein M1830_010124 [Pleopsidium flavum]
MTQPGVSGSLNGTGGSYGANPEVASRGTRRRKFAGYLKAANELRQSYQQSYGSRGQHDTEADEDEAGIPGAFPDVAIVRSGDEEMVLFPSYARRHVKKEQRRPSKDQREIPGSTQELRDNSGTGDADYWRKEWEKYEDDNAVVDVDVRGWMYSPHRGPMTRKKRLLIGLARHLSGVPAPAGNSRNTSRASSPQSTHRERLEARAARHEEALVEKEAENITKKGEGEADVAERGCYSEETAQDWDKASIYSTPEHSRTPSPDKLKEPRPGHFPHPLTDSSLQTDRDDAPGPGSLAKRASWNQPADMSPAELAIANNHLMARLTPFLNNPLIGTPLTVFFYNDHTSQSRTIVTNEAGHFSIRAALDFVPTNVRVLASENLSATEEVLITEPTGISLISDIDDTIKHSAIGSGAKEIFRNTFIRELGDLAIEGVKEWYTKLAEIGVKLHYVSNSPWQLYPVLVSFFALAGLPPGSFHLKQYSGMLQGIFEPVAERKKGTLERILHDFPERRFLLVGDSGEADLELYTDIVVANPGRILGVFIRDVTTSKGKGFFDASMGPLNGDRGTSSTSRGRGRDGQTLSPGTQGLRPERKPALSSRNQTGLAVPQVQEDGNAMGTLIDFDDGEPEQTLSRAMTDPKLSEADRKASVASTKSLPPTRPSKPLALRSASGEKHAIPSVQSSDTSPHRKGPIPPPKPRRFSVSHDGPQPTDPSPLSQTQNASPPGSRATSSERRSYRSTVRNKVTSAYNSLPSPSSYWYGTSQNPSSSVGQQRPGMDSARTLSTSGVTKAAPPPPPRRHLTSYPAAAAHYASNRISGGWSGGNDGSSDDINGNPTQPLNKKVELWKRRWARAKETLESKGVMLRTWRVGTDVMDDAVRLVQKAKGELNDREDPLHQLRSK